jgi:hypothetical protein
MQWGGVAIGGPPHCFASLVVILLIYEHKIQREESQNYYSLTLILYKIPLHFCSA